VTNWSGDPAGNWQQPAPYPNQPPHWQAAPYAAPPRRSRTPWIVGAIVGVVVLVAAVVGIVAVASNGSAPSSPGETVKGYLEALARGDAEGALSYATDIPGDPRFLTDEVLKEQIEHWPITDIRILSEDGIGSYGSVHVSAKFGDHVSDVTISLDRFKEGWKLKVGAIKIEFHTYVRDDAGLKTLTFFGQPIDLNKPVYVFPGWLDVGNSNPYVEQKSRDLPLLLDKMSGYSTGTSLSFEYSLNAEGRTAIRNALQAELEKCARSRLLAPPNCPQSARRPGLVDGTAQWTWSRNLDGLRLNAFLGREFKVLISGETTFRVDADSDSGPMTGEVTAFLSGEADLAQDPPAVSFRT
jgi:hypothetical protein